MNWSLAIYAMVIILFTVGVTLASTNAGWRWNLGTRANRRYLGITNMLKVDRESYVTYIKKLRVSGHIIALIKKNKAQKMDREIFEGITFLRNLAAISKGADTSTDYIIQKLAEHTGILQPIYLNMLSQLRMNKKREAILSFYQEVGTPISKDFARLLIQWDEISPSELSETLLSYEKSIKEIRITSQKRRDEIVSELIYFPVVLNVLIIFINFIYVAYFIQQKELLQMFI